MSDEDARGKLRFPSKPGPAPSLKDRASSHVPPRAPQPAQNRQVRTLEVKDFALGAVLAAHAKRRVEEIVRGLPSGQLRISLTGLADGTPVRAGAWMPSGAGCWIAAAVSGQVEADGRNARLALSRACEVRAILWRVLASRPDISAVIELKRPVLSTQADDGSARGVRLEVELEDRRANH
jgi:hypothetical protein